VSTSQPVLPKYGHGALSDIVPVLCAPGGPRSVPGWMPASIAGAPRVVMLLLDGLGWNQLEAHREHMPMLSSFVGSHITTVAPTTTATALTSLVTGLAPGEHGIIGYRMDMGDTVMNVLRWADQNGDLRRKYPPQQVQPCPPFLGLSVPVLSKGELQGSGFTLAHLAGVKEMGWRAVSSIPVIVRNALASGEEFVYVYYDGVDKIAHERGFGEFYEAELRAADALVADILSVLPSDTVLVVTADHGQVHVGDNTIIPNTDVSEHVHHQSGEGRFRWLHARRGRVEALRDACQQYENVAWVVEKDQVLSENWFGPRVTDSVARRMGDIALVAHAPVSFDEPLDSGPYQLVCRHGSLTADEMLVPLLAKVV